MNPVQSDEDFNRNWDQKKYENFRRLIHTYRQRVDAAIATTGTNSSLSAWRDILGDDFGGY